MAINYGNIWDKTMFYLKNETKFFTSTEVKSLIVTDAFNRIAEEVGYPKTNHSSYLTSGEWQVSAPSNFIKVDTNSQVTYQDANGTIRITPKELTEIGRENVLTATPGVPSNYFLENETKIGIYPPCTSGCIVVPYVARPTWTTISGEIQSGCTNELTERCYMAATYWTVAECLGKDEDARAAGFLKMYWDEISRLKSQYNMMLEIRRDIRPHEGYTR